jgi:DNA-binding FadR family transcriptional regulator
MNSYSENVLRSARQGSSLTYHIVQDLGVAIVTGRYTEANPFPTEGDLCKQYKVSRSIMREAVKMLTAKGLLGARPRHGTWVQPEANWSMLDPDVLRWLLERKFSPELLIEFTEIRLAFEPAASALAAEKATPEQIDAIRSALERMRAAEEGQDDPLAADIAFHVAVLRASGNRFYEELTEFSATALRFSIRRTNEFKGRHTASVADHARIAQAIIAGDAAQAEESMRTLIRDALDLLKENETERRTRSKNAAPVAATART